MVMFQQMGFGLAIAVLVDATIVRSILVPATLKLLGNHSWYMPRWLEWIPNVSIGEGGHDELEPVIVPEKVRPIEQPVLVPVPVRIDEDVIGFNQGQANMLD